MATPADVRLRNVVHLHFARLPKTPLAISLLVSFLPVFLSPSPSLWHAFGDSSSGVFLPSGDGTPHDQ